MCAVRPVSAISPIKSLLNNSPSRWSLFFCLFIFIFFMSYRWHRPDSLRVSVGRPRPWRGRSKSRGSQSTGPAIDDVWTCNIQSMMSIYSPLWLARLPRARHRSSSCFHLSNLHSHFCFIVPRRRFAQTASPADSYIVVGFFYFIQPRPCNRSTALMPRQYLMNVASMKNRLVCTLQAERLYLFWLTLSVQERQLVVSMFESALLCRCVFPLLWLLSLQPLVIYGEGQRELRAKDDEWRPKGCSKKSLPDNLRETAPRI